MMNGSKGWMLALSVKYLCSALISCSMFVSCSLVVTVLSWSLQLWLLWCQISFPLEVSGLLRPRAARVCATVQLNLKQGAMGCSPPGKTLFSWRTQLGKDSRR